MDTQLMGASRVGDQFYQGMAPDVVHHAVVGEGRLAMRLVHPLAGTMKEVGSQGKADGAPATHRHWMLQQGHIGLGHQTLLEKALQAMMGLRRERHHQKAAGVHVEPMHHHGPPGLRIAALHQAVHRRQIVLSRHRQHARGLAQHHEVAGTIHLAQLSRTPLQQRIGIEWKPLEHELQDGAALGMAGRVEMAVHTHLAHRRTTHPELGHAHGPATHAIAGLQQFGCTAVACPRRRAHRVENLQEGALFATGVGKHILAEQPVLKRIAALPALGLQAGNLLVEPAVGRLGLGQYLLPVLPHPAEFGLQELALTHHFIVARGQRPGIQCGTQPMTLGTRRLHALTG